MREKVGLAIPKHMVEIPVVIKTFKSWADDANENNNYIWYLLISLAAQLDNSFHSFNFFPEKNLKSSKKLFFILRIELNFKENWLINQGKIQLANLCKYI